jgi:hypothetical protein
MSSVRTRGQLGAQEVQGVGEGHVLLAEHRVLAELHQHGRLRGQAARPVGDAASNPRRHDAVDDADPLGLLALMRSPSSSSSLVFLRPTLR